MSQGELLPAGDSPINMDAWNEWCEYRAKYRKKKVSEAAKAKQWKMLALYDHDTQQQIIDHSISNDYTGLFPPKGQQARPVCEGRSSRDVPMSEFLNDRSWAQ